MSFISHGDLRLVGVEGLVRDHLQRMSVTFSGLYGVAAANETKMQALLRDLKIMGNVIVVEGDSMNVIK
ncbi:hypothetical protein AMTR_s00065p00202790 [Amborella trichopoda]|uniref:Uncharacterized protein n=1 Tax=Amborella trichopoda TaxID=13333 RepID=U5DB84_AMBTC|nr:hypothetical protein AMTR_s00065p00202790 [Amborella trichopoda]